MGTFINIGTDKKNIQKVKFNKPYDEITYQEIKDVVHDKLGPGVRVQGWADATEDDFFTETETKDLAYYETNANEDYVDTPMSVLRYIVELEELVHGPCMGSFNEKGDTC